MNWEPAAEGRRLRVCLVMETYWPQVGGGETAGRMLAHGLVRRGCDVSVFTRRSMPGVGARDPDGEVAVRRLPPGGSGPGRKWVLSVPMVAAMLATHDEFDVVAVLGFRVLGAPVVTAGRLLGLPVVLKAESRGEMSGEFFRPGLERLGLSLDAAPVGAALELRNRILRSARAFVAMSGELEREFLDAGVPSSRIHRIPNAVDVERFAPAGRDQRLAARHDLGVRADVRLLAYTGRLVDYKGLPELIEVWPRIVSSYPAARLVLVGAGGSDIAACETELRSRVEALGISDTVRFPGAVDDVVPWLHAADAFVFPSHDEAFGLSLVEAMACGLPAVTTSVGGLADIAASGKNALVVQPGDAEALLEALRQLAAGGPSVEALGEQARRTVEERFSRGPVIDSWKSLLLDTVETP